MEDFSSFIEQFGFPIFACVALFWMLWKVIMLHREERANWSKSNTEDRRDMVNALTALKDAIKDSNR